MRKAIVGVAVGLALGAVSAVSAVDLSVGGGGVFAGDWGGGFMGLSGKDDDGKNRSQTVPWVGGGLNVFFDAQYAEVGVGLTFGGGNPQVTYDGKTEKEEDVNISFTSLNIGVLGKYPIALSDAMTLFPAVGIDYALMLSATSKYDDGEEKSEQKLDGKDGVPKAGDFSALWIKFGVGADVALTGQLFLRPELLYGIRLANKYESDSVDEIKKSAEEYGEKVDISPALGHGLTVKVGLGFRL
ncbi:MAG: hypothetical protein LBB74_01480 [Chitinispirillales bacterium]|jgi:hypothetical protein|nr:hypothetical protein [Chitinispirillales bacterium]